MRISFLAASFLNHHGSAAASHGGVYNIPCARGASRHGKIEGAREGKKEARDKEGEALPCVYIM